MINKQYLTEYKKAQDSYKHCVNQIVSSKGNKHFYIGSSANPEERLKDHVKDKNMKNMFLLCEVPNKLKSGKLEKRLIKRFSIKNNVNQSGGGEGIDEGIDEGINYVYLLLK